MHEKKEEMTPSPPILHFSILKNGVNAKFIATPLSLACILVFMSQSNMGAFLSFEIALNCLTPLRQQSKAFPRTPGFLWIPGEPTFHWPLLHLGDHSLSPGVDHVPRWSRQEVHLFHQFPQTVLTQRTHKHPEDPWVPRGSHCLESSKQP